MKKGDRVSVTVWGQLRSGTVAAVGRGKIIWVKMDDDGATNWFHLASLTPEAK